MTIYLLVVVSAVTAASPAGASGGTDAYCSSVCACLGVRPRQCPEEDCRDLQETSHDREYCRIFQDLHGRGLDVDGTWGRRVYRFLSEPHRVVYRVAGRLPLPAPVTGFLLGTIPFAAELVNAYTASSYQVVYTGPAHRRFRGDNGDGLAGKLTTVQQDENRMHSVFFGYGSIDTLLWKLYGNVLIVLD